MSYWTDDDWADLMRFDPEQLCTPLEDAEYDEIERFYGDPIFPAQWRAWEEDQILYQQSLVDERIERLYRDDDPYGEVRPWELMGMTEQEWEWNLPDR